MNRHYPASQPQTNSFSTSQKLFPSQNLALSIFSRRASSLETIDNIMEEVHIERPLPPPGLVIFALYGLNSTLMFDLQKSDDTISEECPCIFPPLLFVSFKSLRAKTSSHHRNHLSRVAPKFFGIFFHRIEKIFNRLFTLSSRISSALILEDMLLLKEESWLTLSAYWLVIFAKSCHSW